MSYSTFRADEDWIDGMSRTASNRLGLRPGSLKTLRLQSLFRTPYSRKHWRRSKLRGGQGSRLGWLCLLQGSGKLGWLLLTVEVRLFVAFSSVAHREKIL